jgi:Asp-tRNA(Asn)/Glu-tRNA(Gln) amidotransferase A subunit family amidase
MWDWRAPAAELLAREAHDTFHPLVTDGVPLGADTRRAIDAGAATSDARYQRLLDTQRGAKNELADLLRTDHDLIVMPLEADLPDPADRPAALSLSVQGTQAPPLTLIANFGAAPVLALPVPWSVGGPPLGIQVLAAPGAESLLVEVCTLFAGLGR